MAALTWFAADTDTIRPPDQLHGVFIHPHQTDGVHIWQDPAVEATRPHLEQKELRAAGSRDIPPALSPLPTDIQDTRELAPHDNSQNPSRHMATHAKPLGARNQEQTAWLCFQPCPGQRHPLGTWGGWWSLTLLSKFPRLQLHSVAP